MNTGRISIWLLGLVALVLPVNKVIMPGLLGLLVISSIWSVRTSSASREILLDEMTISGSHQVSRWKKYLPLYILACIFLLHVSGLMYSEHLKEGTKELEYKLSYIAFALISIGLPSLREIHINRIFDLFTAGSAAFAIGSVGWGVISYLQTGSTVELSYGALSHPFHPTYMAMYHALSIVWIMKRLSLAEERKTILLCLSFLALSGGYIILLASKAGILSMLLAFAIGSWYLLSVRRRTFLALAFASVGLSAGISFVTIPTSSERIDAAIQTVTTGSSDADREVAHSSVKLRQVVWKASAELLMENPFGVGTGDTTPELIRKYDQMGEHYAAEKKLNCHNQFLQVACEHGWPALILLVSGLVMLSLRAWKARNLLFGAFLAITGMNFMFESCLEVQAGIVFFFFFSMIFLSAGRQAS